MKFSTIYSGLYGGDGYPFHVLSNKDAVQVTNPEHLTDNTGALIIWGGSDIGPHLYGHEKSRLTFDNPQRDRAEWALMQRAIELGITIIGVCRGAQMACAAAGGFLLQDVRNHSGHHPVETQDGMLFMTNSLHHQMMCGLDKVDHELIAWSVEQRSKQYIYQKDELFDVPDNWKEPEYVFFPKIKAHAIQWHPEMMDDQCAATRYVINEINKRG